MKKQRPIKKYRSAKATSKHAMHLAPNVPGSKVGSTMPPYGVYHTGALNKDNRASAWARGWNAGVGTYQERINQVGRYVDEWSAK